MTILPLSIPEMTGSQNNKYLTANDQTQRLANATQEELTVDVSAGGTITISLANFVANYLFKLTGSSSGAPAADFNLDVPSGTKRMFAVYNATFDETAMVRVAGAGGDTVEVRAGEAFNLYSDTTDIVAVGGGSFDGVVLRSVEGFKNTLSASEVVDRKIVAQTFTLPLDLAGSQGYADTAPSAQTDFDIQRNGTSIGTMRFPNATKVATFIGTSIDTTFSPGDRLTIHAPGTLNGIADVSWNLRGIR